MIYFLHAKIKKQSLDIYEKYLQTEPVISKRDKIEFYAGM